MADIYNVIPLKNGLRRLHHISNSWVTDVAKKCVYDVWETKGEG